MGIKERQAREREEMRELILKTANNIIATEGLDNLSIRKIAHKIEYSPAIIYHYFKDKEDIVNTVMNQGYKKIIEALTSVPLTEEDSVQRLRDMTRNYIEVALSMPDEYKAIQLNTAPEVLAFTSSMSKGASQKKPALALLSQTLKDINKSYNVDEEYIELTAQVIAVSTFGLIMKLILEKDFISEEQQEKLINHYIKLVTNGFISEVGG